MHSRALSLQGRIDQTLNVGDVLTVQIDNNWNSYAFKGQKKVVLSTVTWCDAAPSPLAEQVECETPRQNGDAARQRRGM